MGSKSASTSPTSSVHGTPSHQAKPNTLDPFADLGNLGAGLGGGKWNKVFFLEPQVNKLIMDSPLKSVCSF